jgi:hypothetical protein
MCRKNRELYIPDVAFPFNVEVPEEIKQLRIPFRTPKWHLRELVTCLEQTHFGKRPTVNTRSKPSRREMSGENNSPTLASESLESAQEIIKYSEITIAKTGRSCLHFP